MSKTIKWSIVIGVLLGVAAGLYVWRGGKTPAPPAEPAPMAAAPETPPIRYPIEDAGAAREPGARPDTPLPALADSDKVLRDALAKLFGRNLEKFFHLDNLIRRVVATVDNLPLEQAPPQLMPVKPVPGWLVTTGKGETLSLSPKNAARYRPYVALAESVPTAPLVALYVDFYPLFQEQYEKLGYPGRYFNDRLVQVIDHLLATPEAAGPLLLVQSNVLYQFADQNLERLSAGQKILLRMGGENGAKLKAKLKEIRGALVARPPKR